MVRRPGRQYGARRDLFPCAGSDRRHDRAQLRLHQRDGRDPRRQRHHFRLRLADRLSRGEERHRHRPADARRGFWLYRLDHHVADLRVLYLHLLRARGGHPRDRARDVLRDSAAARLSHQRGCHHSAGDLRHHADQPFPALDATGVDRAPHPALCGDRLGQPAFVFRVDEVCRRTRRSRRRSRPAAVRHRRLGGVFAGRADRRTGRLPALPAARPPHLAHGVVGFAADRRPRLDHFWRP